MAQVLTRYWTRLKGFSPNVRFYLVSELGFGLSYGIYALIFNLYVDSMGYPRSFLGELQSLPSLIALFGAVPAGVLVDHTGRKKALLLSGLGHTVATMGIVLAPDASWLRISMILFGISGSLWMVTASPFMMENSSAEERNALFSAHFGLTTLVGFFGTLFGGYLPTLFGGLQGVDVESPAAYAATLGVIALLSAVSLVPLFMIREGPRAVAERASSFLPWRNITDRGMAARIFVPNIVISMGAAILIPYMNLFFKESFGMSDRSLGMIFAVSAVITGTVTLASPILADRWGRIRSLVMTQLASIPFLLAIGFSPALGVAVLGFWVRAALMNMGSPLYNAFSMEQVAEKERATVSGLMGMSWNLGWTIGPYVSGTMQDNPNIGWQPIFVVTCLLYLTGAILAKVFFQRLDDRQRRAAVLKKLGVADMTVGGPG